MLIAPGNKDKARFVICCIGIYPTLVLFEQSDCLA